MARQKANASLTEQMKMSRGSASTAMTGSQEATGLSSKAVRTWMSKVKKAGLDIDTILNRLLVEKRGDENIAKCSDGSLIQCALTAASLGLTFGKEFGQAYPVAFWDSKDKCFKAQLMVGYRGYSFMALRDAGCRIVAHAVYENDDFKLDLGGGPPTHYPAMRDRGEIVAAWAKATFEDGQIITEFVNQDDLAKIRESSNGYRNAVDKGYSHPWITWASEMARKSAVKRICKFIPTGADLDSAPMTDGLVMGEKSQYNPELDVIDAQVETVPEKSRTKKLSKAKVDKGAKDHEEGKTNWAGPDESALDSIQDDIAF